MRAYTSKTKRLVPEYERIARKEQCRAMLFAVGFATSFILIAVGLYGILAL